MTCPSCYSCGMPLERPIDHALGDININYCIYCADSKGMLKPFEEVLKGMAHHLAHSQGMDEGAARKAAENVLLNQPAWKGGKHV